MGILPMSEGLTQTHEQDARATAGTPMLPSIGRCAGGAGRGKPRVDETRTAAQIAGGDSAKGLLRVFEVAPKALSPFFILADGIRVRLLILRGSRSRRLIRLVSWGGGNETLYFNEDWVDEFRQLIHLV